MPQRSTMTGEEFVRLCVSIWGVGWKKPAARHVGRDPKMVRRYEKGEFAIPIDVADAVRSLADIGTAGYIIKEAILDACLNPDRSPMARPRRSTTERAHECAMRAVEKLRKKGLLTGIYATCAMSVSGIGVANSISAT